MLYDTLQPSGGTEKSLADWGISLSSVQLERTNQAADTFRFTKITADIAAESASPTFAFESIIIVRSGRTLSGGTFSGGVIKFVGKRVLVPMRQSSHGPGASYEFHGPWYDLENTLYQQTFLNSSGGTTTLAEAVLNTSTAISAGLANASLGDQIQAALQWVLDQYSAQGMAAPFQYKGRTLNSGVIDLNTTGGPGAGTGANYSIEGTLFNYAMDASPTIESGLFAVYFPSWITRPMRCSDVIRKELEMLPRICVWFDYTTVDGSSNPLPTFHCTLINTATPVNLALFDGTNHKSISITKREDMVPRAIVIVYRITSVVGGVTEVGYVEDKWGPHGAGSGSDPSTGLRVINEIIDLSGLSISYATAHLDVEPLNCSTSLYGSNQADKRAWWSSKRGGEQTSLIDSRVRFAAGDIPDATIVYASSGLDSTGTAVAAGQALTSADISLFTNRIVRGTQHAWMKVGSTAVKSVKVQVRISAVNYFEYDQVATGDSLDTLPVTEATSNAATNGSVTGAINNGQHVVNIELTNGTTGAYGTISSFSPGELYIAGAGGIANYLYDHLSVAQYDADYVKVDAAFDNSLTLGNSVNLTGGDTAWTTMNAMIQSIREDFGTHQTSVRIGAPRHLNSGQLSSLLNAWRNRRPWYNPQLRVNNTSAAGSNTDLAITSGNANTTHGLKTVRKVAHIEYNTAGVPSSGVKSLSVIDPAKLGQNDAFN